MRWRKEVTAATLPELEAEADRSFPPGTTYSIYSVREEGLAGVIRGYRAEAIPPGRTGTHNTPHRPGGARAGHRGSQSGATGGVRSHGGTRTTPDGGVVTGRVIDPPAGGPGAGSAGPGDGDRPERGQQAGAGAVPGAGPVAGYNAETVSEVTPGDPSSEPAGDVPAGDVPAGGAPGWRPEAIPARVLDVGPGLNTAYALLQDPELDLPPRPAFATDDPEFVALLDRAAPVEESAVAAPAEEGMAVVPVEERAVAVPADESAAAPTEDGDDLAVGDEASTSSADVITAVPTAPSIALVSETGPRKRTSVGSEVAGEADRMMAAGASAGVETVGETVPDPVPGQGNRDGTPPAAAGRPTVVYVGLLDDPVEAAERRGSKRWSAAGVLNGGQPGARVVCYGLGDGSNVERLAQGLLRYQPMRLVLAVDPSRKHADTQAWVNRVATVVQPSSLVAVARTATSSPGTVQELGYPVQVLG